MQHYNIPRIAITQGDTNGVGLEVALKTLSDERIAELCTPILFASPKALAHYRRLLENPDLKFNRISNPSQAREGMVNLVEIKTEDPDPVPGPGSPESGAAALASLSAALEAVKAGDADALLTAPIDKNAIQSSGFNFHGHTEYLAANAQGNPLMILFNDRMRVALVTTHLPISQVSQAITADAIVEKLRLFNESLCADFSIVQPRIAVLALNPHAGDGGLLGKEEQEVIRPAIQAAKDEKILCFGPYSADGFFGAGLYGKFDGVLAMYHDQGLAPLKTVAMDSGVNFTAGLDLVRTSPDHGTAPDIAGQGTADPESMRRALYAAIDIARSRAAHAGRNANPLRRQYFDRPKSDATINLK